MGSQQRNNIDTSSIQAEDLEREAHARQNLEEEKPSATEGGLGNTQEPTIEEEGFCETPRDSRSGESFAAAEPGKNWDKTELKQFQALLTEYGRRSGRKSPPGWAYTIVKNLKLGIPCTYWEEFQAGVPIGTCDRREWETAPGVPCTAAKQCLEERFLSKPGTTPIEAALQVSRVLANPQQMAIVWESIKARVVFLREEWRRQSGNGVQHAVVDSWMRPKENVSDESAAVALSELQQNLPQQLQASETVLSIGGEIACAIESETENLGLEIDVEEQKRNISRLAQLLRGKRGGRANIAPTEVLKCAGERSIDTQKLSVCAEEPQLDTDLW